MKVLTLLLFAVFVLATHADYCPAGRMLIVYDNSETSAVAASTNSNTREIDITQSQMQTFLKMGIIADAPDFKIGVIGYSSNGPQTTIIPIDSSPAEALTYLPNFANGAHAGSWTYRGAEAVLSPPTLPNNILVFSSAQGSGDRNKTNLLRREINRISNLGWYNRAIGFKGGIDIDIEELNAANNDQPAKIYIEPNPQNPDFPKSFRRFAFAMNETIRSTVCKTLVKSNPIATGPCSQCVITSGTTLVRHENCSKYIQCFAVDQGVTRNCAAGTFFDGTSCNFMSDVPCPQASCTADDNTSRYPSEDCCNSYYACEMGKLRNRDCSSNQAYDPNTRACITPSDLKTFCGQFHKDKNICNFNMTGPISRDCNLYAPDPLGDPCKYQFFGYSMKTSDGTTWNQDICSLVYSGNDICSPGQNETITIDKAPCRESFRVDYSNNNLVVYSPRKQKNMNVHTNLNEAVSTTEGIEFSKGKILPQIYYFYFASKDFSFGFAFRIVFRLNTPDTNVEYDILSNAFCRLCNETASITAIAASTSSIVITATFVTTRDTRLSVTKLITVNSVSDKMQVAVTYNETAVSMKVYALNANNIIYQSSEIVSTPNVDRARFKMNKCGIMLGRGTHTNFQGTMYQFAYTDYCEKIDSVIP